MNYNAVKYTITTYYVSNDGGDNTTLNNVLKIINYFNKGTKFQYSMGPLGITNSYYL